MEDDGKDASHKTLVARRPRLIGEGLYHHVYAWGNDKHPVFKDDVHYYKYLKYLEIYSARFDIDIVAYALMSWHIHLFLLDLRAKLSQFMSCLHGQYARSYNRATGKVGHVFGERFNNKVVQSDSYGLWLSRYIHRQAVKAGLVSDPRDYKWTSYSSYIGQAPMRFLKPGVILDQFGGRRIARKRYKRFVMDEEEGPIDWSATSQVMVGDDEFLENVKTSIGVCQKENVVTETLIELLSDELGVDAELLRHPQGKVERALRQEAFRMCVDRFDLSVSSIARVFGVVPNTVNYALRK